MILLIQTLTSMCGPTRNHSRLVSTIRAASRASSCNAWGNPEGGEFHDVNFGRGRGGRRHVWRIHDPDARANLLVFWYRSI